jgi:hypothetical protein
MKSDMYETLHALNRRFDQLGDTLEHLQRSEHLYLTRPNREYPKERPPDAIGERRSVSRSNPSFSRQALHRAVDNGAEFGGVLLLASPCQSRACIVNAEPGGVAVWFLRRLGLSNFQHESLHHEFLDARAQPGVAFWL